MAPDIAKEIAEPAPCGLDYVWGYWLDVSRTRQSGFASPAPLTYSELHAWASLRPDIYINSNSVELIMQVDTAFRRVWSDRNSKRKEDDNG